MTALTTNSWYNNFATGLHNLTLSAGQLAGQAAGFIVGGGVTAIATRMIATKLLPLAVPAAGPVMLAFGAAEAVGLFAGYHAGNKLAEIGQGYGTVAAEKTIEAVEVLKDKTVEVVNRKTGEAIEAVNRTTGEAVNWGCKKVQSFLPSFMCQKSSAIANTPLITSTPAMTATGKSVEESVKEIMDKGGNPFSCKL